MFFHLPKYGPKAQKQPQSCFRPTHQQKFQKLRESKTKTENYNNTPFTSNFRNQVNATNKNFRNCARAKRRHKTTPTNPPFTSNFRNFVRTRRTKFPKPEQPSGCEDLEIEVQRSYREIYKFDPMPRMYIISGCNGAGKTTASYSLLPEMLDCREFVNSDEFAKGLSPFDPSKAAIQASKYMILKFRYLLKKQKDFAVETTLATRTLLKTVKMAQDAGYTVTLLYFWLNSPEMAIERVKARVAAGGHDIPEDTIRRRYSVGIYYFFNSYAPICERWILADNSQIPFRVIAEGSKNDVINIKDEATFEKIKAISDERQKLAEENGKILSL